MLKKIFIILIFFKLTNCGYTPIYSNIDNTNFKINKIILNGDRNVNNYLKTNLQKHISKNQNEGYELETTAKFDKIVMTKDSAGKVSIYKLILNITFNIKTENFNETYNFEEEFLMETENDKFSQKTHETSIMQNLTNKIYEDFILKVSDK